MAHCAAIRLIRTHIYHNRKRVMNQYIHKRFAQCTGHDYTAKSSFSRVIPAGDTKERQVCDHCGFIYYSNPKIATGVLCTYKDKILLTKRNIEPQYGFWCFCR